MYIQMTLLIYIALGLLSYTNHAAFTTFAAYQRFFRTHRLPGCAR